MPLIRVKNAGAVGVIKDLSLHELPVEAWTDCQNIRFLDGYAYQSYGYGEVYQTPQALPQHVFPVGVAGVPYWIYLGASKAYAVTSASGTATHTDLTHATPLTGTVNAWTSTLHGGIPVINAGNATNVPAYWDLNLANKFVNLSNWPANTYCKALRSYKNYLVALNVTKTTTNYPFMVKWSHPSDPGSLPSSWDQTDATKDAGEFDLAEGFDQIVDGLQLRDSFIIYKEQSTWAMTFTGGPYVFAFRKLFGHGLMNRNCAVEYDGMHFAVTQSDVILHDGNTAVSCLDKQTRRYLFQNIDVDYQSRVFVFKHPFMNEIYVCYPSIGATACDKAMVWNYKDKTISFQDLPNVNHASYGPVNSGLAGAWSQDPAPWAADLTIWNQGDFVPNPASVLMASANTKLFLLDSSASFDGAIPSAYLERRGLSLGAPESIKLVKGIRPRITGNPGETVTIKIGYSDDPYADPTYTSMTHTIGTTVANDCLVSGRYIAVRLETGTAYQWRLDSYCIDIEEVGQW